MIFTKSILTEARSWIGCTETSHNRSVCVDEIHKLFNGVINSDAWCAKFVWSITNVACLKLRVPNPLFQTASTASMLREAKKTLRVDKVPGVGSVFYTTRTGGGHVGFVSKVEDNLFWTVEGNTTNSSGAEGVWENKRDTTKQSYEFIHLEDLDTIYNNIASIGQDILDIGSDFLEKLLDSDKGKTILIISAVGVIAFLGYKVSRTQVSQTQKLM